MMQRRNYYFHIDFKHTHFYQGLETSSYLIIAYVVLTHYHGPDITLLKQENKEHDHRLRQNSL